MYKNLHIITGYEKYYLEFDYAFLSGYGIACGSDGNVYITGYTRSGLYGNSY